MGEPVQQTYCASCGGTGWEFVEGKGVRPCRCKQDTERRRRHEEARVPALFAGCTLDNYDAAAPALQRGLAVVRQYVVEYPDVDVGLLLLGPYGVGKTHLAVAALRALIDKGATGYFYVFGDLLKAIQATFNRETKQTELEVLDPIIKADVLVLDELGASKPSEWVFDEMTFIINQRYSEKRPTIFTSNYTDVSEEKLADRVGPRVRSRLDQMCRVVSIEAEDYRARIKQRRAGGFRDGREGIADGI